MEQVPQHEEQPEPYVTVLGWSGPNPVVQTPPEAAEDMEITDLFEEQEGRILYVYLSGGRSLALTGDLAEFYRRHTVGQQLETGIVHSDDPPVELPPEWQD